LKHFADPDFWFHYRQLPEGVRAIADKNFALLKEDPRHSSVRLKKIGILYSARIGLHYRALARERPEGFQWFGLDVIRPAIDRRVRFEDRFEQCLQPATA
jgi:hypothetical protein